MVCLPTGTMEGASCVLFYQSGRRSRHPRAPSTGKASTLSCEFLLFSRTNSRALGIFLVTRLVLQRHVRQLSMAQVIIFKEPRSFFLISIRTWLMDQNPCETSHFLAIGVLTQRRSTRDVFPLASLVLHSAGKKPRPRRLTAVLTSRWSNGYAALSPSCEPTLHRSDRKSRELPPHRSHEG